MQSIVGIFNHDVRSCSIQVIDTEKELKTLSIITMTIYKKIC